MLNRVLLVTGVICQICIIFAEAKVIGSPDKDFVGGIIEKPPPIVAVEDNEIAVAFDLARGRLRRQKKFLKYFYPVLMAALFAKLVVVPLILKLLIATTSSAFVMSKIALVTSAVVALSWLLGVTRERAKLQIVQYPANGSKKFYGGWNVKDKYAPHFVTSTSDWTYDDIGGETNDKSFFL